MPRRGAKGAVRLQAGVTRMERTNRFVALNRYVDGGPINESHFSLHQASIPELTDGQVLLQTLGLSVDPYMRGQMTGLDNYFLPQFEIGRPVMSLGVARVVESRNPDHNPGDLVQGFMDWADYSNWAGATLVPGIGGLTPVDPKIGKLSHALGVFGLNGLTAFFGILGVARPRRGETMVLSGAAGGIGVLAGQIARIMGARVIGLAGAEKKRKVLVEQLGFDAALDYRSKNLAEELLALTPQGPDLYFDNVGGVVSQSVMGIMRRPARVIECGQISTYNEAGGGWTVDIRPIHANGLRWESFTTAHFNEFAPAAIAQMAHWVRAGRIIALETEHQGLETAPRAMAGLLRGENIGKMVVTIAA
jgi:NADPH-dependent curcumin reductase CurA